MTSEQVFWLIVWTFLTPVGWIGMLIFFAGICEVIGAFKKCICVKEIE